MILIIVTYLAGVLTILSPCILPVLPFVFARSQQSFLKNGIPLLLGMCLTFSLFSALAIIGGEWIADANEIGRFLALSLLTVFGLSLIFPEFSERLLAPLTRLGSKIGSGTNSSFLIGVSTGLLWAPCAGPILGIVLTGAAIQGNVGASIGLLLAYSLGAATSLAIALLIGNRFLGKFLKVDHIVKRFLGAAVLLGVVAIVFNLDRTVLTQISKFGTTNIENKLLALTDRKPKENSEYMINTLPEITGAVAWINSAPLTNADLKGKVILIDFWTYSCINCLRTLPYVKAWAEKYKNNNFIILGVHTPEFAFEKKIKNVEEAVKDLGITYPVAIDNEYKIWNSFQNEYWPAHYFIDHTGKIRHRHFGEGSYDKSEKVIQELILESGDKLNTTEVKVQAMGAQAPGLFVEGESPETYLGYWRTQNFSSTPEIQKDQTALYKAKTDLKLNDWALDGNWLIADEVSILKKAKGKLKMKFRARDLHLVIGGAQTQFKVTVDGKVPGENRGLDIDDKGMGRVDTHRLYQLIRIKNEKDISDHLFEIEFFAPDVEVYAFTFG